MNSTRDFNFSMHVQYNLWWIFYGDEVGGLLHAARNTKNPEVSGL
jgi:hypothetical protein